MGSSNMRMAARYPSSLINLARIIVAVSVLTGLAVSSNTAIAIEVSLEQLSIYPGEFSPDPLVVKKGESLKILATSKVREHVNRISILPWVKSSETLLPGKTTIIEFTPDEVGDFMIRNIGHGFTGTLRVVE